MVSILSSISSDYWSLALTLSGELGDTSQLTTLSPLKSTLEYPYFQYRSLISFGVPCIASTSSLVDPREKKPSGTRFVFSRKALVGAGMGGPAEP